MIDWSEKEKSVLLKEDTSKEAIKKYYEAFPRSKRTKSSLYTYWWWRKQEEKKKLTTVKKPVEEVKKVKKDLAEEFGKDTDRIVAAPVIHARIVTNNVIEVGDMIKYARTPDAPVGIVVSFEDKKGIPKMSQKIKVNFGNYYMRDVYACDYKIVRKRIEL